MPDFGITLTVKGRHADLWRAVKKLGSQAALARHLGINNSEVGRWCNLQSVPAIGSVQSNLFSDPQWVAEFEKKLFDLTGKTLDELFPKEICTEEFLKADKTCEIERRVELQYISSMAKERLTLPSPEDHAEALELSSDIKSVLKTLSYREREIIKLRFGLGGDGTYYTLDETAKAFHVTRERVRQIEAKAIRKLQQPARASQLVSHLQ